MFFLLQTRTPRLFGAAHRPIRTTDEAARSFGRCSCIGCGRCGGVAGSAGLVAVACRLDVDDLDHASFALCSRCSYHGSNDRHVKARHGVVDPLKRWTGCKSIAFKIDVDRSSPRGTRPNPANKGNGKADGHNTTGRVHATGFPLLTLQAVRPLNLQARRKGGARPMKKCEKMGKVDAILRWNA